MTVESLKKQLVFTPVTMVAFRTDVVLFRQTDGLRGSNIWSPGIKREFFIVLL